jgi:hypothetical protein
MSSPLSQEAWDEMISISEEMSKRLTSLEENANQVKQAIEKAIPVVVADMVKYACIDETQKDALARTLSDPVATLELVKKLAAKQAAPEPLGSPVKPESVMRKHANHLQQQSADRLDSESSANLLAQSRLWRTA